MTERDVSAWAEEDWQAGRDRVREQDEQLHGPVAATFTIRELAANGGHPEEVRVAWQGVPLPVRERFAPVAERGTVMVLCSDGYNALVEAGTAEEILQYWIDLLDGRADENTTFDFLRSDGEYTELDGSSSE